MKILAIDTALAAASVCVYDAAASTFDAVESILMSRGHAEALLPMVDRVMARVEGGFSALGRVAVTVGPGSFTGLRVGLAAARGFALACNVPAVGVSTLAALAAPLILEGRPEMIAVAIDARHGNVFFAAFEPDGRAMTTPRIAAAAEVAPMLENGSTRIVGSGAALVAREAERLGVAVEASTEGATPDIRCVARLGLLADPELAAPRPLYLKPADATPQRAGVVVEALS